MESIGQATAGTDIPIWLATEGQIETVNPPIFAAFCSQDGLHCIRRFAQYKALAGALSFRVTETDTNVGVEIVAADCETALPPMVAGIEMVLLLNLIRKATKVEIVPWGVTVQCALDSDGYARFFGCQAELGPMNQIIFRRSDMEIPFVTRNDTMWEFFEPELRKRLSEMEVDDSFSARVRSALVELIPGGQCGMDSVAEKLGLSRRTLQRKLSEENTTFQQQLNHVRELMAKNYLQNTDLASEDIAFLLGYQDVSSFFRAFSLWTGMGVSDYKREIGRG